SPVNYGLEANPRNFWSSILPVERHRSRRLATGGLYEAISRGAHSDRPGNSRRSPVARSQDSGYFTQNGRQTGPHGGGAAHAGRQARFHGDLERTRSQPPVRPRERAAVGQRRRAPA